MSGSINPLAIGEGDPSNPLSQGGPTWANAWSYNANAVADWVAAQRAKSAQMGLWNDQTGLPTASGVVNAAGQYGNALMMGTTAPGVRAMPLDLENLTLPSHLTAAERDAVATYASSSPWVNGPAKDAEPVRQALDSAIAKSELGSNATLYRGFGADPTLADTLQVGNVVPLASGHVSTTLSKDTAQGFADDLYSPDERSVLVRIQAPKGQKALAVPTSPEFGRDPDNPVSQHELLLPRGTQFKITGRKELGGDRLEITASPTNDQ